MGDGLKPYYDAWTSSRLRIYDVINQLKKSSSYVGEVYQEGNHYDIVIFQKAYDSNHIETAQKLKNNGVKIVFDMNIDGFNLDTASDLWEEEKKKKLQEQKENLKKMIDLSDTMLTASEYLWRVYSKSHGKVYLVEENVTNDFFKKQKNHTNDKDNIYLLYSGYSKKADELNQISDVLKTLHQENVKVKLLFVSDKDPEIEIIPYEFILFDNRKIPKLLIQGDIKVAPRDLSIKYNLGHTINKVAYPMALGIPAVASPVPSYLNRGVLICETEDDWYRTLKRLVTNVEDREYFGKMGRDTIKSTLNSDLIGKKYISIFNLIL